VAPRCAANARRGVLPAVVLDLDPWVSRSLACAGCVTGTRRMSTWGCSPSERSRDVDPRNPLLSAGQMRNVLSRSLTIYADRHAGRRPANLVVHKTIPFTDEEAQGVAEAWGRGDGLTCISLTRTPWRGVLVTAKGDHAGGPRYGYAVDRRTVAQLDGYSALIWVAGNAPDATLTGKSYLQGGKGTPRPLMLTRHVGRGPLTELAAQVLALSKMDWNTDALYSSLPATLTYAQLLARIVKNEKLPPLPFDYRLFM
jgi:hypothetical protein